MPGQIASSYKAKRPGTFIFTNPGISSLLSLISDNKDNTSLKPLILNSKHLVLSISVIHERL